MSYPDQTPGQDTGPATGRPPGPGRDAPSGDAPSGNAPSGNAPGGHAPGGNVPGDDDAHRRRAESGWAVGGTAFAAVLLLVNGVLDILRGVSGIAEDDVYTRVNDYVFRWSATGWGWALLIIGIVAVLVGLGLFRDALWARVVGVFVASASIVAHFLWLPYFPVWALIAIAIDAWVIWALTAHRGGER
ncbi:DUF7144 family membrane protein [Streptomyces evansiae]|uniref:DUF7144 family membrane protein n=1 Tax=Streptomyces evansiae TaxID=3075535 RepID=UPI002888DE8C|nr:hypothetical protein [Streptomyces sp. DSM 41859]MDT0423631.1 hypothetical protein [Streptomyces sp. DSM 41859]